MKIWQVALIGIPLGLMFAIGIPYVLSRLDPYLVDIEIGVAHWLGLPIVVGGATFTIYSVISTYSIGAVASLRQHQANKPQRGWLTPARML